jgi:tripartite-type tricarboxylate transporter receptor subunit TctC
MMKRPRRQFLKLAAGAIALPAMTGVARAQAYPARPVRIIVGFPPGGINDIYARLIAEWLSRRLGQSFYVENKPGAGGNIGTETVVRAPPDGYTLLLITSIDARNATLYDNLKFNFVRDIAAVASISENMGVLVALPSSPVASVVDLIAAAKRDPGAITVASAGVGTGPYFFFELFRSLTGTKMLHVPYRGEGPALTDLLGGQVQLYFATVAGSIEYIRAGKLRPLAVTGASRASVLPDVPAIKEFVPAYEATGWVGIGAPRNTASAIIDKLNKEINDSLADPALKQRVEQMGGTIFASAPAEFDKFIAYDTEKWGKVIRAAGIKAE